MPPKQQQQQRRTRKQILEEDLAQLIRSGVYDDEQVYPVLREALKEGLDVNRTIAKTHLFCFFAENAMIRCFDECFLVGADPVPDWRDVLSLAVASKGTQSQILRMVIALSNHKKFHQLDNLTALKVACRDSLFEVVEALIRLCDVDLSLLLCLAIMYGSVRLVDFAIEKGADVNQQFKGGLYFETLRATEKMPLQFAAMKSNGAVVDRLLKAGAKMTLHKYSFECPLHLALECGNMSVFKVLFNECKDTLPCSLLAHQAVLHRRVDILRLILAQNNCEPGFEDDDVVDAAIARNDLEIFKILFPYINAAGRHLKVLVRQKKYEMLDVALFEAPNDATGLEELLMMLEEAPNDKFKKLIQKKIDIMNGVKDEALKEEPQ